MKRSFPTITAHTGCDGTPLNTVESALEGLRLGADCVEVDVRADPDGRLFLWHHDEVELAGGGAIPLRALRIDELRSLERQGRILFEHPRAQVTTFDELAAALERVEGRINLDLKDDRSTGLVGPAVRAAGLDGRALITGCEIARVSLVRKASPSLPIYLNTNFRGVPPDSLDRARMEEECRIARDAGCCGLNVQHGFCAPALVAAARARGLLLSAWTVAPEHGFERFVDMGVDNITTRHVGALCAFRAELPGI